VHAGPVSEDRVLSPSIRSGFAWTLAGNGLYAASQWAILSLTAKLGGPEMLGQYALVVALTTPVMMLAHLNLRAVLATDVARRHPFGDYLAVRLGASAVGILAVAWQAAASGRSRGLAAMILLAGLAQSSEAVSDIFYGAMQRRGEMPSIGRSMMARGLFSMAAFGVTLYGLGDLAWALAAMAAARVAVLVAYDWPRGAGGESLARSGGPAAKSILRAAFPLGLVLLLISLNTNLPRYIIERRLGIRDLGAFAAVAAFMTVGSAVVNALGQSATPKLAHLAEAGERKEFLRLTVGLASWVFGLGLAGVAAALALGPTLLALLYRGDFATYSGLLVAVMGAATLGYVGIAMGFAITAARAFDAQVPLFCLVAAVCGAASWLLVPRFGLSGAVMALGLAACAQIAGEAVLLGRALNRMAAAR
jgi:O-antigen/teichoic acid export membrane protein